MPYTTTNILNPSQEIYNYIEDVNYGMSKPQLDHLSNLMHGLIVVDGNKSINSVSKAILSAKDSSSIYKFLSKSEWDNALINRNRISHLNLVLNHHVETNSTGLLIIDDTINPKPSAKKVEGLDYHFSHIEGKSIWSHCVVTSNFLAGDISVPVQYQPYYRKEQCEDIDRSFLSKVDIAKKFIADFNAPSQCNKIYVLADSWYSNKDIVYTSLQKGYHFIGAVKSNRLISPKGIKLQLSQFAKHIAPCTLDVVTVKDKDYRVYVYEGPVAKLENALVVISYEVDGDDFKNPVYLISTDIELDAKTIIEYYSRRWSIETNYKYLKSNLGFDKYRIRNILSIERYFLISFLAINFLEIIRLTQESSTLRTIGEAIEYQKNLSLKEFILYIYKSAKRNKPLQEIYSHLKIA
ncbi:IS701 family transposase [Anaerophilus nitritogenes]|uniref:IS701 family transposase n=1 Tax=Anaerophilus nitritogenes TaxID=2498136 RepID=UPI00101BDD7B|nr:IS701 family transposase [Anaerophilus nitritogenes]